MQRPEVFSPLAAAVNDGLGREVTLVDADGNNGVTIMAIPRLSDDEVFSTGDFTGSVQPRSTLAFATADAPEAAKGWRFIDADGSVWELRAVRRTGRGRSRAEVKRVS